MTVLYLQEITQYLGFRGGSLLKNLPVMQEMQEMPVWSLGQEDPLEEGMVTHFKTIYSCLENPKDRGAWQAKVHRVAKSWAWLSDWAHTTQYLWKLYVYWSQVILLFKNFFAMPRGLWDPSSLTRDWTQARSSESAESLPLDCQGIPNPLVLTCDLLFFLPLMCYH